MAEPSPGESGNSVEHAFQTIVAGLISGFLAIVLSIGFANLVLTGDLRPQTPVIVGMALFSTMMLNLVAAVASPIRGGVNVVQEVPIVVLSTMAASIAATMTAEAGDNAIVATIVAACVASTIIAGLAFFALGYFRLGGLIRFVPYPVIGGFLAGTGWLILQGGTTVIMGDPVTLGTVGSMIDGDNVMRTAASAVVVAVVAILGARSNGTIAVPVAIFAMLALYNVVAFAIGIPQSTLRAEGWLVPLPDEGSLWPPLTIDDLGRIDWAALGQSLVALPGLILVSALALLMNATGIELDRGHDIDVDAELRALGLQNIAAGATGGIPGFPAVSLTLLATRLGAANRGTPIMVAGLCAAALLFQQVLLGLVPTPLLGGLLVWIGGGLMATWLVGSNSRLSTGEYAIVALIFVVIATAGFTWGILAGLAASVALFAIEYSRADVVHTHLRGDAYHSNVEATETRRAALRQHGGAIVILRLQGYLFFGTADRLRRRVLSEVSANAGRVKARFVLIDFRRVTGVDSSAISSFARLIQAAERSSFTLVIASAEPAIRDAIERSFGKLPTTVHFEPEVERGLFWCENALLAEIAPSAAAPEQTDLATILTNLIGDAPARRLMPIFAPVEFAPGEWLIEQGSPSNDMFVLGSGRATVTMLGRDGRTTTIASLGAGGIIGEVAFYRGEARTAGVVAEEPTTAWRLTRADLARLHDEEPEVTAHFHHGLARALAERLARTDRLLAFLVD